MKKILIVDDDKNMHDALVEFLSQHNSYEFLHAYKNEDINNFNHSKLNLIICDVYLEQKKSGIDLVQDLRVSYPKVPIILTSGEIQKMNTTLLSVDDLHFISRPYVIEELYQLIDKLL